MRSPLILLCVLFSLVACTTAQLPEGAIELPKKIEETSGLASFGDHFLTLNDSGGKATLYPFNKKGERLGKHKIEGAINRDWEDIAQDSTHILHCRYGKQLRHPKRPNNLHRQPSI